MTNLADAAALQRVRLQLVRIREGARRLVAAGKPLDQAIAAAVESQIDEDERRRFPAFYHWRREVAPDAGSFKPPVNPVEQGSGKW